MNRKILFTAFALLLFVQVRAQQVYFNEEWTNFTGDVGEITRSSSLSYGSDLIVVSNTINTFGNTDVLITRYSRSGEIVWESTFDGDNSLDDYGIKAIADGVGNIYVAASIGIDSADTDIGVLKYSSSGALIWSTIWDGTGGYDIPADIQVDDSSNVYVVGGSQSSNGFSDFAMIKMDSSGFFQWDKTYDYANLHDAAVSITLHTDHKMSVYGASASNIIQWDNVLLTLNKYTGDTLASIRMPISGNGMESATDMSTDADNIIYLTGYTDNNGNKDILVVKIAEDFSIDWIQNYDGGYEDYPVSVRSDDNGNVFVAGVSKDSLGIASYLTLKYDDEGTLLWTRKFRTHDNLSQASASGLYVKPNGESFVTGTVEESNGRFFNTVWYDSSGTIKSVMKYKDVSGLYEFPSVLLNDNDLYLTGIRNINSSRSLTAIRYTFSEREMNAVIVDSVESHVAHEIIMRFGRDAVIPEAINRKGLTFGPLDQFVKNEVIDSLNAIYPSIGWKGLTTYKIFTRMTMADSISTSRNGHTVKVQPFWATLLIHVGSADEVVVIDSIRGKGFPLIQYLHTNDLVSLTTDDTHFPLQHSIVSTTYPEAHINIEPAWALETGSPDIKVGVYDTGLQWGHEDLGAGFGCGTCKVKGGWNYQTNSSLFNTSNSGDPLGIAGAGHGTKVAGVIGGFRNNGVGISGIAGGDMTATIENPGVSLYGFRAIGIGLSISEVCNALVEGAVFSGTGYGYGLDVMNNSWKRNTPYDSEFVPGANAQNLFADCHREISRNQVVFVASRGNMGGTPQETEIYFPGYAKYDRWVLSVGGSNQDGNLHGSSSYAGDVDLIAPYSTNLIYTTTNTTTSAYSSFDGTSAAAAHASGVTALMLSYINTQIGIPNNLAPDDVEFLMERYAKDRDASNDPEYLTGYDEWTGWGLLDAGNVMEHIDRSEYIVRHVTDEVALTLPTGYVEDSYAFEDENMPYGIYTARVYDVSYTLDNNLLAGDDIVNYWPLDSYATLLAQTTPLTSSIDLIDAEKGQTISGMNNSQGTISGKVVHLISNSSGAVNYWSPAAPGQLIRVGYTLHIRSDFASVKENNAGTFAFDCYPNPASESFNVRFNLDAQADVELEVYDLNGRRIYTEPKKTMAPGECVVNLDSRLWAGGIYFVNLRVGETTGHAKIIKK